MPFKLRILSGDQMVRFFGLHGFRLQHINGSHMKIVRKSSQGSEMIIIPRHKVVPRGTTKAIYNQAKRFIREGVLRDFFYTK